jgi:DNA-binding MarR family transcriptional regulator
MTELPGHRAMSAVLRVHQLMMSIVDTELRDGVGLKPVEYFALMALQTSDGGTESLGWVARQLGVHATTVTVATDHLEEMGLVSRKADPQDRRATLVSITNTGRTRADAATEALKPANFGLPGLTAAQTRSLISLLTRVRRQ